MALNLPENLPPDAGLEQGLAAFLNQEVLDLYAHVGWMPPRHAQRPGTPMSWYRHLDDLYEGAFYFGDLLAISGDFQPTAEPVDDALQVVRGSIVYCSRRIGELRGFEKRSMFSRRLTDYPAKVYDAMQARRAVAESFDEDLPEVEAEVEANLPALRGIY